MRSVNIAVSHSPYIKLYIGWLGPDVCLFLGPPGFNWWFSFAPVFQWCCGRPRDRHVSQHVLVVEDPSLLHHGLFLILIVDYDDSLMS